MGTSRPYVVWCANNCDRKGQLTWVKRTLVLFIALVLAGVSAVSVFLWLNNLENEKARVFTQVVVFRATQLIEVGTDGETARDFIITDEALSTVLALDTNNVIVCDGAIDADQEKPGAADLCLQNQRGPEFLEQPRCRRPISAGQIITTDMFVTAAELNTVFLSEDIAEGKVAISFRPGEDSAVGGFTRPGDRINLIASAGIQLSQIIALVSDPELRELIIDLGIGEQPEEPPVGVGEQPEEEPTYLIANFVATLPSSFQFTQTIMQDIEVIAVGPDTRLAPLGTGLTPQGTQIIVAEVTSDDAEKIEFAKQNTSVALTLLPKDATYTSFDANGVLVDDLFSLLDRIEEQLRQVGATLGS